MKYLVFLLAFVFILVEADRHLNANGPFRKRHALGDEPSPHACNRGTGIRSSKPLSVANINVSARTYSSSEEITISWTPVSSPCVDDFLGIYFVDIDPLRGKSIFFKRLEKSLK